MRVYSTLFILCIVLYSTLANAFDSRGPNIAGISLGESIHEKITEKALKEKGFSHSVIEAIEDANTDVDWDEASLNTWKLKVEVNEKYRSYHHFDRLPGMKNKDAFKLGARYIAKELENAVSAMLNGRKEEAIKAIGKALHTLQDFFAHSNFVDLNEDDKKKILEALFNPELDIPSSLKLTGYDPEADEPGMPKDDDYPHDKYAKDSPDFNEECKERLPNGKTKYQEAFNSAVEATGKFIDKFKEKLKNKIEEKISDGEKAEEEFNKIWDGLRGEEKVSMMSYDKLMAMAVRYFPLIETKDKNTFMTSVRDLINDFVNGVSPEYPFGRNEIFSSKINYALMIAEDYMENDVYNASRIANMSIEYAKRIVRDANEKGVEMGNLTKIINNAEKQFENGNYLEAIEKISTIEYPFDTIYPEYQNPIESAIYVISIKANGKFLDEKITIKWKNYERELKTEQETFLIAPAGSYSARLPIDIKLFGVKIWEITLAKLDGSINDGGIAIVNISISTYFIPYSIAKFLMEHFMSIIIILILIGAIRWKKIRRKE